MNYNINDNFAYLFVNYIKLPLNAITYIINISWNVYRISVTCSNGKSASSKITTNAWSKMLFLWLTRKHDKMQNFIVESKSQLK